jgi:hypothetical protein
MFCILTPLLKPCESEHSEWTQHVGSYMIRMDNVMIPTIISISLQDCFWFFYQS